MMLVFVTGEPMSLFPTPRPAFSTGSQSSTIVSVRYKLSFSLSKDFSIFFSFTENGSRIGVFGLFLGFECVVVAVDSGVIS